MPISLERQFAKHIRSLREARGMTQEKLAELAGVSVDAVTRIETGRMVPTLSTIAKLAKGLGISLRTLFETFGREKRDDVAELADYLADRTEREVRMARRVLRAMFEER